ncbi:MAG TPA: DMT family transporter [Gemmatimonadaceae bacterium]|jgi:drug/metabolite transporter (DMT)-like permease
MSSTVTSGVAPSTPEAARSGASITDALLVAMALIWGVNASVMKLGVTDMPPLVFNAARLGLASVALVVLALAARPPALTRRDVGMLLALGVLGTGLYQFFMIEGLARTRAGTTALILSSGPAFVALFGRLLGVERITRRGALGIVLSMAGIAFVALTQPQAFTHRVTLLGSALVLIGCICWSLFAVLIKPYANRLDGRVVTAITIVGGTVPLSLLALPAVGRIAWEELSFGTWGAIVYAGLASMVIAYLFWNRGVRLLGPTRTAMFGNLQPIFALVAARIMLAEQPSVWQLFGAAAIIAGVLLTRTAEPLLE